MIMGLNIKDAEAVALVAEVARRMGTTKTGAVRELAREKLAVLEAQHDDDLQTRIAATTAWLEQNVWPLTRNLRQLSQDEEDAILGHDEMFDR